MYKSVKTQQGADAISSPFSAILARNLSDKEGADMARLYRSFMEVCWALGVGSMLIGVILKFVPGLSFRFNLEPRGALIMAGVLFLCSAATRAVGRTGVPAGH
jgi:hypothetical protein